MPAKQKKTIKVAAATEVMKVAQSSTLDDNSEFLATVKTQINPALASMLAYFKGTSGKSLFPEVDSALHLQIVYKLPSIVSNRQKADIELPHSMLSSNASLCLIMPDLDTSQKERTNPDVTKQSREWAEKIEKEHGLTSSNYARIVTKREMEREYGTAPLKRQFATMYDVFLVDARVGKAVRSFLGKEFHKAHKVPLDFKYDKPLVDSMKRSLNIVRFSLQRYATRVSVSCGHLGQPMVHLIENVEAVLEQVAKLCPGGVANIRSIHLQPTGSKPSLPIYADQGSATVAMPKADPLVKQRQTEVTDECSTLPDGLKIAVRKDGKIRVVKKETGKAVMYPTVNDEWAERDDIKPTIDPKKIAKRMEKKAQKLVKTKSATPTIAARSKQIKKRK